ncbi:hypothetical protein EMIT0158MI4_130072 [Burkholderia ambifaria]
MVVLYRRPDITQVFHPNRLFRNGSVCDSTVSAGREILAYFSDFIVFGWRYHRILDVDFHLSDLHLYLE